NPHSATGVGTIYTPVLVEVEQYLKGGQPQRQLLVYAIGGTVGQDWIALSDGSATFQEGERVVLFLSGRVGEPLANSGRPLWDIYERYTVIENMATNSYRTLPLQQLLDEVAEAQKQP